MTAARYFTLSSFLVRLLLVAVLVLLTYKPTGFSYLHWLRASLGRGAAQALAGVVVAIGWIILLRATFRSLGGLGLFLGAAFFGTLVWWTWTRWTWPELAPPSGLHERWPPSIHTGVPVM